MDHLELAAQPAELLPAREALGGLVNVNVNVPVNIAVATAVGGDALALANQYGY
ncbi:hypothetical protein [Saccharopolyspora gloriosae]|uniref:hypothetical protein n=1 Tax=Saccharopolyspora gloriosae TaxID=455344 RepID=UPI001FB693D5|nr:hypothetical protein [Saccharopolyspora gloriosae]